MTADRGSPTRNQPADAVQRAPAGLDGTSPPQSLSPDQAFSLDDHVQLAMQAWSHHLRAAVVELDRRLDDTPSDASMARVRDHLKEVERQHEMFGRAVAHDLRNPLAVIRGQVQLLARRARRASVDGLAIDPRWIDHGLTAIDEAVERTAVLLSRLFESSTRRGPDSDEESPHGP